MGNYDFDTVINRRNTNSAKWDTLAEKYNQSNLIHLGVADMDFEASPAIIQAIERTTKHGIFGYTDLNPAFFSSIVKWHKEKKGIEIKKEWIVFCPRINIAAGICVNVLTNEDDEVILNTPVYPPLKDAVELNQRRVIRNSLVFEMNQYKMDFKNLERKLTTKTKMLILTNPDNPTGRVWTKEELTELHDFCRIHKLTIFCDEIHSSILKKETSFTSILSTSFENQQHIICADSITKAFNVPGTIISYMIVPNIDLRNRIREEIARIGMNNPNIFSLPILEAAYNESDLWLTEANQYIDNNEKIVREFFQNNCPEFIVCEREGTYLLWIHYKKLKISEQQLMKWFIEDAGVEIYPGSHFGLEGQGFFRMTIACPQSILIEALNRMKNKYYLLKQED